MKMLSPPNGTDFKRLRSENVFAVSKKKRCEFPDGFSFSFNRTGCSLMLLFVWEKARCVEISRGGHVGIIMYIESVRGLESFEGNL